MILIPLGYVYIGKIVMIKTIEIYKRNGIDCVSAGHIFDYIILMLGSQSLLTIMMLRFLTQWGVIGYSVFMNKPHIMLKNDYKLEGDTEGGRGEQLKKFMMIHIIMN